MEPLFIQGTKISPEINFKPDDFLFSISGRSIPNDADIYYYPVLKYLESVEKNLNYFPKEKTLIFDFNFIYYNSTTIRYLNSIMEILERISEHNKILVKWHYDDDDEFLEEAGEYFKEMYDLNIEMIIKPAPPIKNKKNI